MAPPLTECHFRMSRSLFPCSFYFHFCHFTFQRIRSICVYMCYVETSSLSLREMSFCPSKSHYPRHFPFFSYPILFFFPYPFFFRLVLLGRIGVLFITDLIRKADVACPVKKVIIMKVNIRLKCIKNSLILFSASGKW